MSTFRELLWALIGLCLGVGVSAFALMQSQKVADERIDRLEDYCYGSVMHVPPQPVGRAVVWH